MYCKFQLNVLFYCLVLTEAFLERTNSTENQWPSLLHIVCMGGLG